MCICDIKTTSSSNDPQRPFPVQYFHSSCRLHIKLCNAIYIQKKLQSFLKLLLRAESWEIITVEVLLSKVMQLLQCSSSILSILLLYDLLCPEA